MVLCRDAPVVSLATVAVLDSDCDRREQQRLKQQLRTEEDKNDAGHEVVLVGGADVTYATDGSDVAVASLVVVRLDTLQVMKQPHSPSLR